MSSHLGRLGDSVFIKGWQERSREAPRQDLHGADCMPVNTARFRAASFSQTVSSQGFSGLGGWWKWWAKTECKHCYLCCQAQTLESVQPEAESRDCLRKRSRCESVCLKQATKMQTCFLRSSGIDPIDRNLLINLCNG